MAEEQERKKRIVVESLGWLTESSIMPKKQRSIEGVGPSSILELKAQLYKSQEESKKAKELNSRDVEFHRAKKKITSRDSFSSKNSGVEARALKDKLELKAVNDGSESYAALERKAELYEKLVKGELSDEEDKEKYCVDFFRKGVEQETEQPQASDSSVIIATQDESSQNDASILFDMKFVAPGRTTGTMDNDEHKRFVRSVAQLFLTVEELGEKWRATERAWLSPSASWLFWRLLLLGPTPKMLEQLHHLQLKAVE